MEDAGVDVKAMSKEDMEALVTVFKPEARGSQRENILTIIQDGKQEAFQVHPELYRAMKSLDKESANLMINILSIPATSLRLGATALNPAFVATNIMRDTATAMVQSKNAYKAGLDTYRGAFHALGKTDIYHEWRRAGGEQAAMFSMDRTTLQKNLDQMLENKVGLYLKNPFEALRIFSEKAEETTRLAEYAAARRKGKSPRESAFDAREVTLDFARMGAKIQAINRIVPFFNAAIQGTDKIVRTFRDNPKSATVKAVSSITIPSMLLYAANKDNEEYKALPRWQKDYFWMLSTKGTALADKTPFIRIPKPHGYGVSFGSSVERVLEYIETKDANAFDGLLNSFSATTVPPVSVTAVAPFVEAWANKSFFTDMPIVPKRLQGLSPENQYVPWTSEFAKGMSKMFSKAGIKVSPMIIENTLYGTTGGLGKTIVRSVDPLLRPGDAPERPTTELKDIPIIGSFVTRKVGGSQSMADFYDRLGSLDQKYNDFMFGRRNPNQDVTGDMTKAERREHKLLKAMAARMGDITKRLRKIESSDLSGEEKRKRIDRLSLQRRKVSEDAMKRAKKMRSAGKGN